MDSQESLMGVVFGIIIITVIGAVLFYGAIAALAVHFIHKFW